MHYESPYEVSQFSLQAGKPVSINKNLAAKLRALMTTEVKHAPNKNKLSEDLINDSAINLISFDDSLLIAP
jgi:hypothetical protein